MSFGEQTRFVEQGSLEEPLIIGRLVRFALSAFMLYGVYQITIGWPYILEGGFPVNSIGLWIATAFAFWIIPPVINIGFSLNTGRLSQWIIAGVSLMLGVYHYFAEGVVMGYALGVLTVAWVYYCLVHLGFSLFLAGVLATPGCELRSIPQLWTLITGRATREHHCPGFLDGLDRWERERQAA